MRTKTCTVIFSEKDSERVVQYLNKNHISEKILCAEYESVYRYALSLCNHEVDAQDITQETFFKAINAYDNYKGGSSLYTWLCEIAKNSWLNKSKKTNYETGLDDFESIISNDDFEQRLMNKDMTLHIHKMLHSMDEPYKEVFTLRVFGELPFADIAHLFSKTESWARVTYHRSKKVIIEKLRKDGYYEQ